MKARAYNITKERFIMKRKYMIVTNNADTLADIALVMGQPKIGYPLTKKFKDINKAIEKARKLKRLLNVKDLFIVEVKSPITI